ncbi:MAG: hypothetical protein A2063_07325 [Gallionellales bacterium GWA2_60_142]|nr:MAG: hypothetical protein A2063_07325 [Gallionellales bacterium GWA2_60_142]HCI14428.1 hypothetical protein [Gallionellaceae bacterium]
MITECPYCQANVDAKVIAFHESYDHENDPGPFRANLLECPACKNTLLAGQYQYYDGERDFWEDPTRVWPQPKRFLSWHVPELVRTSIAEADRCIKAGAYIACAAMCGRALEGVCRHFKTKSQYLGGGLKELLEGEVIDKRLFQWSQELQKHRNLAAHATDGKFSRQDAEDLLEFVVAICDYVFVLNEKFNDFMQRKAREADGKKT